MGLLNAGSRFAFTKAKAFEARVHRAHMEENGNREEEEGKREEEV